MNVSSLSAGNGLSQPRHPQLVFSQERDFDIKRVIKGESSSMTSAICARNILDSTVVWNIRNPGGTRLLLDGW